MKLKLHPDQPTATDIKLVDGVFVKKTQFRHANMIAPQHVHAYAHLSACTSGAARVEVDGLTIATIRAGDLIVIEAGKQHIFTTLEPRTTILCIHNEDHGDGDMAVSGAELIEYV